MRYRHSVERPDLIAAAVLVRGVEVRPSGEALRGALGALYDELRAGETGGSEATRAAVRKVLRNGRYRPSGRGKPAQEYLRKVFDERGELDLINTAVDVNNAVSLRHGLPISAFDADRLEGDLTLRLGAEGERYQFNASGQELDCRDLVVVCDERGPAGSPVKDSQRTKVFEGATSVLYVVYANGDVTGEPELLSVARELGELLARECSEASHDEPTLFER